MTKLLWDQVGERRYETGVDHGVLYIPDVTGVFANGYAWNGLVSVTESPSGAEATAQYADNIKYLNLVSAEEFSATLEAFTYPTEFEQCDGTAELVPGVTVGQQNRKPFGLSYRTRVGNDLEGTDHGYKIHLVYNALAAPSEKPYATINDSPEAITFSWEMSTTPVAVPGFKPAATLVVDSTKVDPAKLLELEEILYGTAGSDPRLPLPEEVHSIFEGSTTLVTVVKPTQAGNVITIPTVTGVVYQIDGQTVSGDVTITEDTMVSVKPAPNFAFNQPFDEDWLFEHS